MTTEKKFDVEGGAGEPAEKPVGQPTPAQPLSDKPPGPGYAADPKPADAESEPEPRRMLRRPVDREPVRGSIRRGPAGRKSAPAKPPKVRKDGVFFLFRPGFLLLLGAVLLSILWGGGFFAHTDEGRAVWPWELFILDGEFNFQWTADHIETLLGAFFVVFFFFGSFTPARPGRGAAVLTVTALGLMLKPPNETDYPVYLGYLLLGLGVASLISRAGLKAGQGGRAFVFVMVILLAASLFFPATTSGEGYDCEALRAWGELTADGSLTTALRDGANQVVILQAVVLVVALLSVVGLSGTWAVWVAGFTLYVAVLAPLTLASIDHLGGEGEFACLGFHQALVTALPAAFVAFVLPAAAGVVDAARDPLHP